MGAAGGIAIAGVNMWALLLDKDPGHSAAAGDLAVDVVDQKLKKTATVAKVEKAPPAATVAKPAKRGDRPRKNKKSASVDSKQQAANVHDGKVQINGAAGGSKQTATPSDDLELISVRLAEMLSREEAQDTEAKQEIFQVVTARGGRRRTVAAPARARKAAPVQEDVATGGANMWALLLDKDPGHSAAASDLAFDVVDQKLKKAAAVTGVAKVEKAPPAATIAEPAKRGDKAKKNKKSAIWSGDSKQKAANAHDGKVQINVAAGGSRQAATPAIVPELSDDLEVISVRLAEMLSREEAPVQKEEIFQVVTARGGRRRTVAAPARARKAAPVQEDVATGGANMWALLLDKDPGHSAAAGDLAVDVLDQKLKKAAAVVQVAKPAKRGQPVKGKKGVVGDDSQAANGEVQMNGAGGDKQTAPPAVTMDASSKARIDDAGGENHTEVPNGDELTNGLEEIKETLSQEEEEEPRGEMFTVVAARGGGRRTSKAAVVGQGTTVDTNMWALLNDNDPGHGGAKPAKRGKRTKTKKKNIVGGSKNAEATMDNEDEALAGELEEEMTLAGELEEEEMTDEAATSGSRCGTVVSRVCKAALVLAMLALYFQLA